MRLSAKLNRYFQSPWFIIGIFIVLIAPFSLNFHFHYPDEMYYTDAGIHMLMNGDFLTTYLGDGDLRFKKPIITYWAVIAGFKLFGISALSSRFFFLIAGAVLVGLTYLIAKTASQNKKIASYAAWIVASQPLIIFSSSRSIPDILLILFVTLGAFGAVGLMLRPQNPQKRYLWALYLGFGLGFAVKGLPAFALAATTLLFLVINPFARIPVLKLINIPAILSGLGVALFWFISMYLEHGPVYLDSFVEDQVGMRVENRLGLVALHFLYACGVMVALFVPWLFFLQRRGISASVKGLLGRHGPILAFSLIWVVAIVLMTSLVSTFYERYLLPVFPLAAVSFAIILGATNSAQSKTSRVVLLVLISANFLLIAVGLLMILGMGSPSALLIQVAIGSVLTLLLIRLLREQTSDHLAGIACAMVLIFFNGTLVSYPLSIPDQGIQVDRLVEAKDIPHQTKIGFIGNIHHSSKMRIALGTDHTLINLKENPSSIQEYDYLICDEKALSGISQRNKRTEIASMNWDPKYIFDIWKSILNGSIDANKEAFTKKYYLVNFSSR